MGLNNFKEATLKRYFEFISHLSMCLMFSKFVANRKPDISNLIIPGVKSLSTVQNGLLQLTLHMAGPVT